MGIDSVTEYDKLISMSEYLTFSEVAEILGISRPLVYNLAKDKNLPLPVVRFTTRSPRVSKTALNKWLEEKVGSGLDILYTKGLEDQKGGDKING